MESVCLATVQGFQARVTIRLALRTITVLRVERLGMRGAAGRQQRLFRHPAGWIWGTLKPEQSAFVLAEPMRQDKG